MTYDDSDHVHDDHEDEDEAEEVGDIAHHAGQGAVESHKETPFSVPDTMPQELAKDILHYRYLLANFKLSDDEDDHLGENEDGEPAHGGAQDGVHDGQGNHSAISSSGLGIGFLICLLNVLTILNGV